ncbi:MAG: flagellar hook protein FlgE [Sulfuricella denitrificans]|nr:flagellar hook protein FlgE [Sulfuricella denitrificans]
MGFQTGLSGLNASSKNLDVIGNNVANASTVGFKTSQAQFSDVFAASLAGAGASQIGIGTKLAAVAQQFTQGNISVSNNTMDVAINGRGFFVLSNNGTATYTRNGQFQLDKEGYIVTSGGLNVTGFQVDSSGNVTGAMGNLRMNTADISPKPTAIASPVVNLDSRSTVPTGGAFPAALTAIVPATTPPTYVQPTTDMYNSSTSTTIYDSLGNPHVATLFFGKTAAAGTWDVHAIIDGGSYNAGAVLTFDQLVFDTSGNLTAPAGPPIGLGTAQAIAWDATMGVDVAQTLNLNFNGTTQFGSPFGVNALTQDGFASGRLSGFSIGSDGVVQGRYTNGQVNTLGQLALANFANPQGLQPLGDNQWTESPSSGQALIGAPGTSSLGVLQSGAVEESNVDLTAELVNMIVAQRAYQANAQTIKTQDQVLQTLVNLR